MPLTGLVQRAWRKWCVVCPQLERPSLSSLSLEEYDVKVAIGLLALLLLYALYRGRRVTTTSIFPVVHAWPIRYAVSPQAVVVFAAMSNCLGGQCSW